MIQTTPWKNWILAILVLLSMLYAAPNLYGEDPALQLLHKNSHPFTQATLSQIKTTLTKNQLADKIIDFSQTNDRLVIRFRDVQSQLKARDLIQSTLSDNTTVALYLSPKTPTWLKWIGAKPLKLGLDLRGGVHFLLHVDTDTVIKARQQGNIRAIGHALRDANIRYRKIQPLPGHMLYIAFPDPKSRDAAITTLKRQVSQYSYSTTADALSKQHSSATTAQFPITTERFFIIGRLPQSIITLTRDYAINQAITILRNRVNELGVSEAIVQRQGADHVSVDLPGIQDTAHAKNIIGKTATLHFQLVNTDNDIADALNGNIPADSRIYYLKQEPVLLKNHVILKGSAISYATATFRDGRPAVNIQLSGGRGESLFRRTTANNIGKPLAVVYIETKAQKKKIGDSIQITHHKKERVINVATIQSALGNNFDITGLPNMAQAQNLALLLRSGALAAPVDIVEELTIGPSLGQSNINRGILSLTIGALAVIIFMALYYRLFGIIANVALVLNIVFIIAILSVLGATLTLPGMAGIVLTVGMAVDANVLINERIREELRRGMTPLASIQAGYARAFSTIVDANVTTLIVATILFALGSGSVKGFAITLIIGLGCSMITSIYITRALVDQIYFQKKSTKKPSARLSV